MTAPFLYQTVHLNRGRARLVAEHASVLRDAARQLFGTEYAPDIRQLAQRIEAAAASMRYPDTVSCFVRLTLTPDGEERLQPAGTSLYDGYALRSLMPEAVCSVYALPGGDAPTSAREAAVETARACAARLGARAVVRCDADGSCRTLDGMPLLGAERNRLLLAPGPESVERMLARRAAAAAGMALSEEPFDRSRLRHFDELFGIDHRGITALSRCDGMPLMALAAERIARAMEALFPKK